MKRHIWALVFFPPFWKKETCLKRRFFFLFPFFNKEEIESLFGTNTSWNVHCSKMMIRSTRRDYNPAFDTFLGLFSLFLRMDRYIFFPGSRLIPRERLAASNVNQKSNPKMVNEMAVNRIGARSSNRKNSWGRLRGWRNREGVPEIGFTSHRNYL